MTIPFRRRTAVRPSPIFLLFLGLAVLTGWLVWTMGTLSPTRTDRAVIFIFVASMWVVSLSLHEFAHAFLAWRFGDHEVEARGYLTLNPFKYAHPFLSIVLPLVFILIGGIGLPGGAVYLHPHRFRTKLQRAVVSLSGPAVNVVFAAVSIWWVAHNGLNQHTLFWLAMSALGLLQVMGAILNLLPVPGLDGWGAIEPYLEPSVQNGAQQFKPFGMLIIFALLQVNTINTKFFDFVNWVFGWSGLPSIYGQLGIQLMQFWRN